MMQAGEAVDPFAAGSELNQYIDDLMERWHIPGLAVAVVDGDDTWAKVDGCLVLRSALSLFP